MSKAYISNQSKATPSPKAPANGPDRRMIEMLAQIIGAAAARRLMERRKAAK